jgi:putative ABC transport system permease protein
MFALIWGAVLTRRAQVLAVAVLTALAAAVAAAGPWIASASTARAAAADVAAASGEQRTVSVREIADTRGDPRGRLDKFAAQVRESLPLPATGAIGGLVAPLKVNRGGDTPTMSLAYRDEFCAHVRLEGPCPTRDRQVAISHDAAQRLGLGPGDTLSMQAAPTSDPMRFTVVALYSLTDPIEQYWSNPLYETMDGFDPAFTTIGSFELREIWEPTVTYDLPVPDALLRGDGGYDLATELLDADLRLSTSGLHLVNTSAGLLGTIAQDRARIQTGVLVGMLQILVLALFAIGLAGRYTGRDRRGDAALLKLRGSTRSGMLRLVWGQHLVPLVLGAAAGLPLGFLLARRLAGPLVPAERPTVVLLSLAAVGAVLAGGLLVLVLIEALVLRQPVATLLRRVGAGRGDWRAGVLDLLLLTVAVAAVYQARAGAPTSGLARAAPALVALAVALLLARLLGRAADRGGGAALRTGHLRLGLTAVQVSRQPGSDRVFALVVVAVAVFATALGGWRGEQAARADRSAAELGAARVLSVHAADRTALLTAVRQADPRGDRAMAAVVDTVSGQRVLAVDSSRLAAVTRWRPEFGPAGLLPAAAADDPGPSPLPAITGDRLTVRLRHDGPTAVALTLVLQHEATGVPVTVRFAVPRRGERAVTAPVGGCTTAPGCRILRWELSLPPQPDGHAEPPPYGTAVTVRGLTQQNPAAEILTAGSLGDIARWRSGTSGAALDVAATDGTLRLSIDENTAVLPLPGTQAYAVDTALPIPVVLAGPPPVTWQFTDPGLLSFGGSPVPVRVVGTAAALPVLGRTGVLVDLEAARRIGGDANPPGAYQVWLAPDAGPAVVEALASGGLIVNGDESTGDRSRRLAQQAPAAVARFALLCGVVALLLAAAAIAVTGAVDRRTRLDQLRALRRQGLVAPVAAATAWAGTAALIGAGLLGGLVAAALAGPLARVAVPGFTDGWDVLPLPSAQGGAALLQAGLAALVVLGLTGWLSVRPLSRRLAAGPPAAGPPAAGPPAAGPPAAGPPAAGPPAGRPPAGRLFGRPAARREDGR